MIFLLVAMVGIQFIPTNWNQSDVVPDMDFMLVNDVPSKLREIIEVSCYDCHSDNTKYPWYNKIQPAAWYLENHITEGKSELNFNEWGTLSDRRKKSKLKSIKSQIENGEMPMQSYTFIHKDAALSGDDKVAIIEYMQKLNDSLK